MDFDLMSIKKFYLLKEKEKNDFFQKIDEETSVDLDLDFLFFKIDKTFSKVGRQYFYSKLRLIEKEKDILFKKYTAYFEVKKDEDIENELKKLNKYKDYEIIDLIQTNLIVNEKYLSFAKLSLLTLILIVIMSFIIKQVLIFTIPLFLANAFFHYKNKNYVEYYNTIITRLQKTLSIAKKISRKNSIFKAEYQNISLKKLERSIWASSITSQFANNEFLVIFWLILEIFQITFNLEIFAFNQRVKTLNTSKQELLKIFEYIGKIDSAITTAKIKEEYENCIPVFHNKKHIEITGIYHPLIDNCVKNDVSISKNSVVITGSNMSGKTSFMRSIAVNAIMAQAFGFCFAEKYEAPKMQILSSISINDDIGESKSYYLEEVLRVKKFLEYQSDFNLILIDEIFKGTNTKERIAISKAVLKSLNSDNNIVFITTHDLEIAKFLSDYNYKLFYFAEDVTKNQLNFTYKLHSGINPKTNAIKILELYNYPKNIIEEAYKLL